MFGSAVLSAGKSGVSNKDLNRSEGGCDMPIHAYKDRVTATPDARTGVSRAKFYLCAECDRFVSEKAVYTLREPTRHYHRSCLPAPAPVVARENVRRWGSIGR